MDITGLAKHPAVPTLLFCLLSLPALIRLYTRVGLHPFPAFLIFTSMVVPFSGLVLAFLPLAVKAWPNFPRPEEKPKPVKIPI